MASNYKTKYSHFLRHPIAFHRIYATITNSACAGLFLSQAMYWTEIVENMNTKAGGWFYKTYAEWERETALNRTELDKVRNTLTSLGLLETELRDKPAKLYFRINQQKLDELMDAIHNGTFTPPGRPKNPNPRKTRKTSDIKGSGKSVVDRQQDPSLLTVSNTSIVDRQQEGIVDRQQEGIVDRQQTLLYTENTFPDITKTETKHAHAQEQEISLSRNVWDAEIVERENQEPIAIDTEIAEEIPTPINSNRLEANILTLVSSNLSSGSNVPASSEKPNNGIIDKLDVFRDAMRNGEKITSFDKNAVAIADLGVDLIAKYRKSASITTCKRGDIHPDFALYVAKQIKGKDVDYGYSRIKVLESNPDNYETLAAYVLKWEVSKVSGDRNFNIAGEVDKQNRSQRLGKGKYSQFFAGENQNVG